MCIDSLKAKVLNVIVEFLRYTTLFRTRGCIGARSKLANVHTHLIPMKQGEPENPKAKQGTLFFAEQLVKSASVRYEAERPSQEAASNQKIPKANKISVSAEKKETLHNQKCFVSLFAS